MVTTSVFAINRSGAIAIVSSRSMRRLGIIEFIFTLTITYALGSRGAIVVVNVFGMVKCAN